MHRSLPADGAKQVSSSIDSLQDRIEEIQNIVMADLMDFKAWRKCRKADGRRPVKLVAGYTTSPAL